MSQTARWNAEAQAVLERRVRLNSYVPVPQADPLAAPDPHAPFMRPGAIIQTPCDCDWVGPMIMGAVLGIVGTNMPTILAAIWRAFV